MTTLMNTFMKEKSFENYSNEAALEFMLTTAGIRGDIPAVINNMLDAFGSFKGILEARPAQLLKVPGVTKKMATLVSTIVPMVRVWERCSLDDADRIGNSREAEAYAKSILMGERTERFFVIALNARCKVLGSRKIYSLMPLPILSSMNTQPGAESVSLQLYPIKHFTVPAPMK